MTVNDFLRIVEMRTKIVSVSSFLIGTLFAAAIGDSFSLLRFVIMAAAVLCVDMGTTAFNSFFDFESGVDTLDSDKEGDKVLLRTGVGAGHALLVAGGLFGAAVVLGLVLTVMIGIEIALIGAGCMAVGYFYTGGPYPISRTPVGELFAGGVLGWVLVVLSYYVQTESFGSEIALVGLSSLFLIAAILTVNNTCDIEGDTTAGRRTLSIVVGRSHAEALVYLQVTVGYAIAVGLALVGILPLRTVALLAVAIVLTLREFRRMHRRGYSHETKGPSMGSISNIFLWYSGAVILSLGSRLIH
jgi:1,4-dihydroxy-2-naphthoate octaprenyltransferase